MSQLRFISIIATSSLLAGCGSFIAPVPATQEQLNEFQDGLNRSTVASYTFSFSENRIRISPEESHRLKQAMLAAIRRPTPNDRKRGGGFNIYFSNETEDLVRIHVFSDFALQWTSTSGEMIYFDAISDPELTDWLKRTIAEKSK